MNCVSIRGNRKRCKIARFCGKMRISCKKNVGQSILQFMGGCFARSQSGNAGSAGGIMLETARFAGTKIQEIVDNLDGIYNGIVAEQAHWKEASPFQCPDGCGCCCIDFEPDVLECEAFYLASWMICHQSDRADAIMEDRFTSPRSDSGMGCFLFDPESPYHCTVYGGRCLICRLFGYSGDRGKDGRPRWKPCKFLPLQELDGGLDGGRQYDEAELLARFGTVPPIMADITAQVTALMPDSITDRLPLREALPAAIAKIRMLERFSRFSPESDSPEPNPESPHPIAS